MWVGSKGDDVSMKRNKIKTFRTTFRWKAKAKLQFDAITNRTTAVFSNLIQLFFSLVVLFIGPACPRRFFVVALPLFLCTCIHHHFRPIALWGPRTWFDVMIFFFCSERSCVVIGWFCYLFLKNKIACTARGDYVQGTGYCFCFTQGEPSFRGTNILPFCLREKETTRKLLVLQLVLLRLLTTVYFFKYFKILIIN